MFDLFLLLTPLFVLGVVALLGFAGCSFQPRVVGLNSISPNTGPVTGGTSVTITGVEGDEFASNATVTFDGAVVPGTVQSQTVITAVTPPHAAGEVTVTVDCTDAQGLPLNVSLANGFTFTALPVIDVAPLLPPALARTPMGTTTLTATLNAFPGGQKLVVVTVAWGAGNGATLSPPTAPGVTFSQAGTTDALNQIQVATFYAFADLTGGLQVTATLSAASSTDFNLVVSAYDNVALGSNPAPQPSVQGTGITPGPSLIFPMTGRTAGDMIYAIVIARGAGGAFKGSLSAGAGFTAEAGQGDYLLLEVDVLKQADIDGLQVNVTATDAQGTATSRWYVFAMAVQHS